MTKQAAYKEIADSIRTGIIAGTFVPHQKISSENRLAAQFGVSRNTAVKALDQLRTEGYIYSRQGKGSFVSAEADRTDSMQPAGMVALVLPFASENTGRMDEHLLIRGVEECLHARGCSMLLHFGTSRKHDGILAVERFRQQGVNGVIIYPGAIEEHFTYYYNLAMDGYPMVFLDHTTGDLPVTCVQSDHEAAGYEATRHLLARGYDEVYFVSDIMISAVSSSRERYRGYCRALKEAGKESHHSRILEGYAMHGNDYAPKGYRDDPETYQDIVRTVLQGTQTRRAGIITLHDLAAQALIRAARAMEIAVPGRIGIIGSNDSVTAAVSPVPLTTVRQNFYEIGRVGAATVLDRIDNPDPSPPRRILVDVELILRESVL